MPPALKLTYSPLPDATTHIRLLRFTCTSSPTEQTTLVFSLTVHALSNVRGKYHAMSYVWGGADNDQTIYVDGASKQVRWNCHYTLWQASQHIARNDYVWIDSICINQDDNAEKSKQVSIMPDIYEGAQTVLASLGPHDEDSQLLFSRLPSIVSKLNPSNSGISAFAWPWKSPKSREQQIHEALGHLGNSLHMFASRRYWTRLWIVPEISAQGTEKLLLCGTDALPFRDFARLYESKARTLKESVPYGQIHGFQKLVQEREQGSKAALGPVLRYLYRFGCMEPLDRVFSLRRLLHWEDIQPDYDMSPFDLAEKLFADQRVDLEGLRYLLLMLGLDMDHPRMTHEVQLRRQHDERGQKDADLEQRLQKQWHLVPGTTTLLQLPEKSDSTSTAVEHTSILQRFGIDRRLWEHSNAPELSKAVLWHPVSAPSLVVLVCPDAQAGDLLVPLDTLLHKADLLQSVKSITTSCLIVRRSDNDEDADGSTHDIVGQAVLPHPWFTFTNASKRDGSGWRVFSSAVELGLSAADTMVLLGQDLRESVQTQNSDAVGRVRRCMTQVTTSAEAARRAVRLVGLQEVMERS